MQPIIAHLLSADGPAGRVAYDDLPTQSRMELLVAPLKDDSQFRAADGDFLPYAAWDGVETDEAGAVTTIQWEQFWRGQSPSLDLRHAPASVGTLMLSYSSLSGPLDTSDLPASLRELFIISNQFCGEFAMAGLPRSVEIAQISKNAFEGPLDLTACPPQFENLHAYENNFSGELDFSKLPETFMYLDIRRNAFSCKIDLSQIPAEMRHIELSHNAFEQDVLVINSKAEIVWVYLAGCKIGKVVDETGKESTRVEFD